MAVIVLVGKRVYWWAPTGELLQSGFGASLKKASKTLDRMIAAKIVDTDAVVAEFKIARKRPKSPKVIRL